MDHIVAAIRAAISDRNWYAALALALALPDMCVKASTLGPTSGPKYARWFDDYVGSQYTSLSGDDCYALRCAYLHEARDAIEEQRAKKALNAFQFFASSGQIHRQMFGQVLQLDVSRFCEDICQGAEIWKASINMASLSPDTLIITEIDSDSFARNIDDIEARTAAGTGAYALKTMRDVAGAYIYDDAPARLQEGLKGVLLRCGLTFMKSFTDDAYIGFDEAGNFVLRDFERGMAPKAVRDHLAISFGIHPEEIDSFLSLETEEKEMQMMSRLKMLFEATGTHYIKPRAPGERALFGWDTRIESPVEYSYKNIYNSFYRPRENKGQ